MLPIARAPSATLKPTDLLHGPIATEAYRGVCELDRIEHAHRDRMRTKSHLVQLTTGLSIAFFPFTPVMVHDCNEGAGWICAARISAFVVACATVVVGLQAGWSMWKERGYVGAQAARMSEHLGLRRGSNQPNSAPGSVYTFYLRADQRERRTMRSLLHAQANNV